MLHMLVQYLSVNIDSFEKIQLLALHAVVYQAAVLRMILVMNVGSSNLFLMITIHIYCLQVVEVVSYARVQFHLSRLYAVLNS